MCIEYSDFCYCCYRYIGIHEAELCSGDCEKVNIIALHNILCPRCEQKGCPLDKDGIDFKNECSDSDLYF